jgi:hypothetical protein
VVPGPWAGSGRGRGRSPRTRFLADLSRLRGRLGLNPTDLLVAQGLASQFSGENLQAVWPSQRTMADAFGLCERTIRSSIAALRAAGILDVETHAPRRVDAGRYTRRTNRYRFMWRRVRALLHQWLAAPKAQRAPRGKPLPQEPLQGEEVTPVVPDRPPPGGEPPPLDPAERAKATIAMEQARLALPKSAQVLRLFTMKDGPSGRPGGKGSS